MMQYILPALLAACSLVSASPTEDKRQSGPTVTISHPQAEIVGFSNGAVEAFNGIPFAQPPVGPLRLKPPQPLNASLGTIQAQALAAACPQLVFSIAPSDFPLGVIGAIQDLPLVQTIFDTSEDCLTLNVFRPAGTTAASKLPILLWIYGGGFELGSTSSYDFTGLVSESVRDGKPVMVVTMNYRMGGFGFLAGKEILADGSANIGLLDQRLAMHWVADNIADFGGDPDKVTLWGESAGSISIFDHFALYDGDYMYNGKPLFRGGIMDSGSAIPAEPTDCEKAQAVYDQVVDAAGCSGSADTLNCLRGVDYEVFLKATNSQPSILTYTALALSYVPRPDGKVLVRSPEESILQGLYAPVPFIIGDQEDEGTLFALFQPNITTTEDIVEYLSNLYFHNATIEQITELVNAYPDDPSAGSPFNTGEFNNWYPQFKRLAAILGDTTFTLSRRLFLTGANLVKPHVPTWSYLASYGHAIPILGTFHATDIFQIVFGIYPNTASASMRNYYFNFAYNLDPNDSSGTNSTVSFTNWPRWSENQMLLQIYAFSLDLIQDTFRSNASDIILKYLTSLRF